MGDESQLQETGNPGIVLSVLTSIERDSTITQRKLAGELGIALGLANAYLRRCVRKGLVKMSQVPLNRYAYYLTPQGFAEKSRLTAEYLTVSLDFFRRARGDCVALFGNAKRCGWRRVALLRRRRSRRDRHSERRRDRGRGDLRHRFCDWRAAAAAGCRSCRTSRRR